MGAAAAPLMAAGIGMQMYGQYRAGKANTAIARANEAYARMQAAQAIDAGEFAANQADVHETALAAHQAAGFAAQGVVSGAGTAGDVVKSSAVVSDADKAMIRMNARRQSYGLTAQANMYQTQGDMATKGANLGMAATLLSGAGQMAYNERRYGSSED